MVYNPKSQEELTSKSPSTPSKPTSVTASLQRGRTYTEYIFCLLVGSMYIYSLNRVIISSTFIQVTQLRLFMMGVAALAFFVVIFYNKYTRIITGAIVLLGALFVFFTLERWERQAQHLYDLRRMVQGYLPYQPELGLTVLWAVSLLLGLAIAIFMLYRFSFYILSLTGVAIFLFTWGPGFTRDAFSFLLFLLCFCLLLIRKTNNGIAAVYVAAPICAALVFFIQSSVPMEAELFQRRTLQELFDGPLSTIGDFIYTLTNPMYFSFQSTGFSGHGGRLGGPVTPNTRNVMTVQAPGRTYLAGVTHNTYTGYRWHSTLEYGQLYTQGMAPGRFEMLETTVALIRGATLGEDRASIPMSLLWSLFPVEDHRHLAAGDFATLGMEGYDPNYYLHTYLPMDTVTIAIGSNRTGTIFRPQNARHLWFHAAGPDYLPSLIFEPSGDMRAPGFMARGAQYTMSYLNINSRLSFIENMLDESFQGMYTARVPVFIETLEYGPYSADIIRENGEIRIEVRDIAGEGQNSGYGYISEEMSILFDLAMGAHAANRVLEMDISATDINAIFELFAHQSPTRELEYFTTNAELMAMLDVFSYEVLTRYAESVREHFMDVPEIVPQRVHDLVDEIIYGLDTDFERIMAIRDYLIQFPYTLTPQPVPDGVCFVDHFLFEGREGYCTYYASAMAIMSRIAGVPSRYVEGFLLPPAETDPAIFVVTNMMAHAWVEVYLEGFGWLIVEATAPYAFFLDPQLTPPPGGISHHWQHMGEWFDWMDDDMMMHYMNPGFTGDISNLPTTDTTYTPTRSLPTFAQVRFFALIGLGGILGLVLLFLLIRYVQVALSARKIRQLPINQQIAVYFKGILEITSHCTSAKDPAETPYAYGRRMGQRFRFKSDSVLLRDLVALYYKARFGGGELSEAEGSLMKDSYFDMVNYLRLENNPPNFFYLRYVRRVGAV